MKVDIERGTRTIGTFKKKTFHWAKYTVTTTPEEREALTQAGVLDYIILEDVASWDANTPWNTTIKGLWNKKGQPIPVEMQAESAPQLQDKENNLQEGLKGAKTISENQMQGKPDKESFEL